MAAWNGDEKLSYFVFGCDISVSIGQLFVCYLDLGHNVLQHSSFAIFLHYSMPMVQPLL